VAGQILKIKSISAKAINKWEVLLIMFIYTFIFPYQQVFYAATWAHSLAWGKCNGMGLSLFLLSSVAPVTYVGTDKRIVAKALDALNRQTPSAPDLT
jgi:hypothetical protein